jgi:hypothetical protein
MLTMAARSPAIDPLAGDLRYTTGAWTDWSAYTWVSGNTPRLDGWSWPGGYTQWNGVHPDRGRFLWDRMQKRERRRHDDAALFRQPLFCSLVPRGKSNADRDGDADPDPDRHGHPNRYADHNATPTLTATPR